MKTVLIVNHSIKECGVQKYGKRFYEICSESNTYNFIYIEPDNEKTLISAINKHDPFCIIYNYLNITMPWFNNNIFSYIKNLNIKQGLIVHNIGYATCFDFFLHQNPNHQESKNNYAIPRLLYNTVKYFDLPEEPIKIGTFGFGQWVKQPELICELVNNQFDEPVELNMHLTVSHFCPNKQELEDIKKHCSSLITKKNIKLKFTDEFLSDNEIVKFLSEQHLNIFLRKNFGVYNGISSVIDYALSSNRPIAVCKSDMFNHINKDDEICIENTRLKDIILYGPQFLEKYRKSWSRENFLLKIESILKNYE